MALEAILWYLAVRRALELPSRRRLIAVEAVTAALMYTHYWDLYLVAVGGAVGLWRTVDGDAGRGPSRARTRTRAARPAKSLGAMVGGVAVWLPWSPVFVFQVLHTGTPWASPAGPGGPAVGVRVLRWRRAVGRAAHLHALRPGWPGLFASPGPRASSVILEFRPQPRARFVALLVVGALSVAVVAGMLTGAAFDNRYIAVVFPLFIVLVRARCYHL